MQLVASPLETRRDIMCFQKGVECMVVVDPATRKLRIPLSCVYPTRAHQRTTIPSLCLLFLDGRCRQGTQCHQVHAALNVVAALRSQVDYLPICCALHGDRDYVNALDNRSWMSRVVVHVPDATYGGGYIPLARFSYTTPISRLLDALFHSTPQAEGQDGAQWESRAFGTPPSCLVLEAGDITLCRLHVQDRCRYAEECNYLHICKEVARCDRGLTLGQRPRSWKKPPSSSPSGGCFVVTASGTSMPPPPAAAAACDAPTPVSGGWTCPGSPTGSLFGANRSVTLGDASVTTQPAVVRCCDPSSCTEAHSVVDCGQAHIPFSLSRQVSDIHMRQVSSTFFPSDNLSLDVDPSTSGDCLTEQGCGMTPNIVVVTRNGKGGRERWHYNPYGTNGTDRGIEKGEGRGRN
ncbi:hypothetical protein, conserved [Trypanosoma brucei gambiense DAL972]|uniref:C3H1-type domain-containing protein n=2 Tax=Trypanosoma brucei TaxID=5691 RepID=C9ZSG7_TRYB9|nr:hypothetical protein, conserved [Trypanosoma brucei gambiense DAL972]RHW71482.1 zinc finger protein family member [Trypanosoma brucei equiperdum]CBH12351.1 hypothetical protein, conserved [Trypanosoma brucei gambiense DAL972]|eukprot:XP_011774632.1 hypothetical protein, conserved [Trypanosoma brucei gambiense DAL972]